eukprot:403365902
MNINQETVIEIKFEGVEIEIESDTEIKIGRVTNSKSETTKVINNENEKDIETKKEKGKEIEIEIGTEPETRRIEIKTKILYNYKLPKKSNLVKVKQKKNTRKIVRFEKEDIKLRQLRYFSISDSPNAAFLNESEIIPLRELPNGASFKNINDMKRADMLREKKTMSGATSKKVMKANELSKMSNINSGSLNVELSSKLVNWSTQQLYYVDLMEGYAKSNGDESDEIKNQRSREKGFQSSIQQSQSLQPIKKNLDEFYKDWRLEQEAIKKEHQLVKDLCKTLEKGLYSKSPEALFKIIQDIKFDIVNDLTKSKLSAYLQQVWNKQIQDFQFYDQQLKEIMMKFYQQFQSSPTEQTPSSLTQNLLGFYIKNASLFFDEEVKKGRLQKTLLLHQQQQASSKNYRTVPCKMYHSPQAGYCNKGDTCHFVHEPKFKGRDIPRDDLFRIRAQNQIKYQSMNNGAMMWQQQQHQPQHQTMNYNHQNMNGISINNLSYGGMQPLQNGMQNINSGMSTGIANPNSASLPGLVVPTVQNIIMLQNISSNSKQHQSSYYNSNNNSHSNTQSSLISSVNN